MDEGGTGGCNEIPKLDHKLGQLKDGITGVSNGIEVHQDSPKLEGKGQSKGLESKSECNHHSHIKLQQWSHQNQNGGSSSRKGTSVVLATISARAPHAGFCVSIFFLHKHLPTFWKNKSALRFHFTFGRSNGIRFSPWHSKVLVL